MILVMVISNGDSLVILLKVFFLESFGELVAVLMVIHHFVVLVVLEIYFVVFEKVPLVEMKSNHLFPSLEHL